MLQQVSVHLKEGQGSDGLAALKNKPQLHRLVAKQLCQNIGGKNAVIFTGPSMTSLSLFSELSQQGRMGQGSEVSPGARHTRWPRPDLLRLFPQTSSAAAC